MSKESCAWKPWKKSWGTPFEDRCPAGERPDPQLLRQREPQAGMGKATSGWSFWATPSWAWWRPTTSTRDHPRPARGGPDPHPGRPGLRGEPGGGGRPAGPGEPTSAWAGARTPAAAASAPPSGPTRWRPCWPRSIWTAGSSAPPGRSSAAIILGREEAGADGQPRDHKTALQELVQRQSGQVLQLSHLAGRGGPRPRQALSCRGGGPQRHPRGRRDSGRSKKEAEQMAAKAAIEKLEKQNG